jgi:splicing factor 3A subunit 3
LLQQIRDRLNRDHQIANFLSRIQDQSKRLADIYKDEGQSRSKEIQTISTGDPFVEFYKQLDEVKDFHRRYPNEPVENLERAYKKHGPVEGVQATSEVENLFTGEESYGRFLDLTTHHENYVNVPGVNQRPSYLQYLDIYDSFTPPQNPVKRHDKITDRYFNYVGDLATYLETFLKNTRPLEDLPTIFSEIDASFEKAWEFQEIPNWVLDAPKTIGTASKPQSGSGSGVYCADCDKTFANENVYKAHLTGKKHIRATEARKARSENFEAAPSNSSNPRGPTVARLKERAVAEREYRITQFSSLLSQQRADTRVNIERKQGMTERERQQELDAFFADEGPSALNGGEDEGSGSESDDDEKIYNPLKLPLAWDGKPIPYWLYKLHGLGVEFPCEICGNFVYMGRRAFDKHFSEGRHVYGLKCLGITNTTLFREITGIEDALKLWDKLQRDEKIQKAALAEVQMEDRDGNVMPEKVYYE